MYEASDSDLSSLPRSTGSTLPSSADSISLAQSNVSDVFIPSSKEKHPMFLPGSFASVASFSSLVYPQKAPTGVDARDRYGFRKHSQYVTLDEYDEWWSGYEKYLRRRRRKWDIALQEEGISLSSDGVPTSFPAKSTKIKRYVRKGIPAEWRGAAWFHYSHGDDYLNANPGLYEKLWQQGMTTPPPDTELIERDLHRTFPDNIYFRHTGPQSSPSVQQDLPETPGTPGSRSSIKSTSSSRRSSVTPETPKVQALRRVLLAFSLYVPKTGYCQSLNFVAGLFLLFMDEEKAFWMLVVFTQKYLPGVHEISLEGANVDQGVLMMCIKESLPAVWNKITDEHGQDDIVVRLPPITLCTAAWFMSGFIGVLPIESVLRVWDSFFYEDSKVFFRIALTVFKIAEPQIISMLDPMEVFQIIQTVPRCLLDASGLMQACFRRDNGFGHISQEELNSRRMFVADKRRLQSSSGGATVVLSPMVRGEQLQRKDSVQHSDAPSPPLQSSQQQPSLPSLPRSALTWSSSSSQPNAAAPIPTTFRSKSDFNQTMQLLRGGSSTNLLSLNARNDYF
ncbi:rab-GTPase-TBC domain-containing protein [Limtongia smithiae]|uniref:rab-GTPase-TBC domain-containing protein n=1 Tax=Limtongia smithiae TaxID=1125753 RepID=UPI0034CDA6FC